MREELIKLMVGNYYTQIDYLKSIGKESNMTLREYLEGIRALSEVMTEEEVEYGVSLAREDS